MKAEILVALLMICSGPGKASIVKHNAKCHEIIKRSSESQPQKGQSPALLYLPLGGSGKPQCLPAAGAKLAHLVSNQLVIINGYFRQKSPVTQSSSGGEMRSPHFHKMP